MFFKFYIKKCNCYYFNISLLFRSRSQEPEPVLKFAWSRKIKKGPARATLVFTTALRSESDLPDQEKIVQSFNTVSLYSKDFNEALSLPVLKIRKTFRSLAPVPVPDQ